MFTKNFRVNNIPPIATHYLRGLSGEEEHRRPVVLPAVFCALVDFPFLFLQIAKNQRYMLWVYTWYICGTSYFLAYSCELFIV